LFKKMGLYFLPNKIKGKKRIKLQCNTQM